MNMKIWFSGFLSWGFSSWGFAVSEVTHGDDVTDTRRLSNTCLPRSEATLSTITTSFFWASWRWFWQNGHETVTWTKSSLTFQSRFFSRKSHDDGTGMVAGVSKKSWRKFLSWEGDFLGWHAELSAQMEKGERERERERGEGSRTKLAQSTTSKSSGSSSKRWERGRRWHR